MAALLGFRFAPRGSSVLSKKLYLPGEVGETGPLGTLAFGQINTKLIIEQWDEMRPWLPPFATAPSPLPPACA